VLSVPLESVGEGSNCRGYGDGGGAKASDIVDHLATAIRVLIHCDTNKGCLPVRAGQVDLM